MPIQNIDEGGIMKKLFILGAMLLPMWVQAQRADYGKPATISGKLLKIKSLHPNPTFSDEIQIAVVLNQQINVDGDAGLVKTKLIQLVDTNIQRYNQYFKKEGKAIDVKCSELFRAETAHHTTKVLCFVDSVRYK